jgi:TolB-like protein
MARRWLLLALVFAMGMLGDGTALAKPPPTIAVMPFRDLTGKGKPHIGEAIREVVASDLKSLSGVRIVERGSLDKIIKEMRVQASLKEVEDDTAAKLGKVVGASVMVIGAFQEESGQIRLTARFVRVETSEVMGSAKVDGNIKQFFRLQDRVTAELLRSSGLPQLAKQVADGSDSRPELKTMDALDLYGRAVTAETDEQKVVLLRSAVAIDQNFSYAVKDLAELEARLTKYQAEQKRLLDEQIEVLRKELGSTTDRQRIDVTANQLLLLLERSRRLHTLRREARMYLDGLPAGPVAGRYFEDASRMLIMASVQLRDWDAVLRDGEAFMQRAPGSSIFETIRLMVVQAIEQKRLVAEGKQKVAQRLKDYPNLLGWDLCQLAAVYAAFQQNIEARRLYEACLLTSEKPTVQTLQSLVLADMMLGDFAAMRHHLDEAEKLDPTAGRSLRTAYSAMLPAD